MLALLCSEPSGELERLLSEITVRIRPVALGTNYTLDPIRARRIQRMNAHARGMLKAYQSPYVLSRFHPHFTVATPLVAPSENDRARLRKTIENRFREYLDQKEQVEIDRLYVLVKPVNADYWDPINEEHVVRLG